MGAGRVHQKGWLGHAVRIEGDSDKRGESLCSAARDGESSGGKDGGSFRVDLGEQAAGLPSGNAEILFINVHQDCPEELDVSLNTTEGATMKTKISVSAFAA